MQQTTRILLLAAAVVALVALAGCSGALTQSNKSAGASLSQTDITVTENGPAFTFDYNTSSYATALLEGPSGDILAEHELSPNQSSAQLHFRNSNPGNYTIAIQQGNSTTVTKTMSFDGPQPEIVDTQASWNRNKLTNTTVTIQNTGDLPARLDAATYSVAGESREYLGRPAFISPGATETLSLGSKYTQPIDVTAPGPVSGDVTLSFTNGTHEAKFSRTFNGPELSIVDKSATWSGSALLGATVTVKNTGDLPTEISGGLSHNTERVSGSIARGLAVNKTTELSFSAIQGFNVEEGDTVVLRITVTGGDDTTSTRITKTFDNGPYY